MVPPLIKFGTSTWTHEGWKGQVYLKGTFTKHCLAEYWQFQYNGSPLFRIVGNDSTFYRPPTSQQLRAYREQMPPDCTMCFKVWSAITVPVFASTHDMG